MTPGTPPGAAESIRPTARDDGPVLASADWVAIASVSTALATLVLAFATFFSVRSANRTARAAEQSLAAQLWPLLAPARPGDPEHDVPFGVCAMVVVELREVATELAKLLAALLMAEVNVHFSYPLLTHPRGFAALALHVDDTDCASSVLLGEGFKLLSQADISR